MPSRLSNLFSAVTFWFSFDSRNAWIQSVLVKNFHFSAGVGDGQAEST